MSTTKELQEALTACDAALIERTGTRPYMEADLTLDQSRGWSARIWLPDECNRMGDSLHGEVMPSPEGAIASLREAIDALPSEIERARIEAAQAVGTAIEKCRAAGYEADFVNPLEVMMKRLSENAIAAA